MTKKNNRAISLLLTLVMLMGMCNPSVFAEAVQPEVKPVVVADLSKGEVIAKTGLTASTEYTRSGDFTMKLSGDDLKREITIPAKSGNIDGYNTLEFYVYSPNSAKSTMTLGIISDNPDTPLTDYYAASFAIKNSGWQKIALCFAGEFSVFTEVGDPLDITAIERLRLWPGYGGNTPEQGAVYYFDKIYASYADYTIQPLPDTGVGENTGSADAYGEGPDDYLLFDFSTPDGVAAVGGDFSTEQKLSGEGSRLSGAEWKNLMLPEVADISGYKYVQMTIYSERLRGDTIQIALESENPATAARDEYHYDIIQSWEGWEVVTVEVGAHAWNSPLGTDQIQGLLLKMSSVEKVYYIDRVWATNSPKSSLSSYSRDDSVNYLIEADDRYQDFDAIGLLKKRYPNQTHPRLILDAQGFENLKRFVKEVPYVANAYANVLSKANQYLDAPVSTYVRKATDMGTIDRTSITMLPDLAMAYKIEGDVKYKDRLWAEIEQIAKWEQVTLVDDLGMGDGARPLALCYDWLYNDWTEEQRRIIRNVIMKNFLETSVPTLLTMTRVFSGAENHNMVANSGIGMCALAFGDEPGYEKFCNQIVNATVASAWNALSAFGPDGVSIEGLDYLEYGQDGMSLYLAALISSLGTDLGISEIPGRSKMGDFVVAVNGMVASFDYSDSNTALRTPSELLLFADIFHDEGLAGYTINNCASVTRLDIRDMLYFREWMASVEGVGDYPRDFNLRSDLLPLASVRSTYNNTNGMYLAFKGGKQVPHGDLDFGSFVYDALGERWFDDSGIDNYNMAGMFNFSAVSGGTANRWQYYTKRAEGHNTIVINPFADKGDVDADQDLGTLLDGSSIGLVDIYEFASGEDYAYGLLDMTPTYTERVASAKIDSAKRGLALIKNRSTLVIQDEIKSDDDIDVYSFLHTMSKIEVAPDKKSAIFTKNGKQLKATLVSPAGGELISMKADSMLAKYQKPLSSTAKKGLTKLAVHVDNVKNPTISLVIQPLYEGVESDSMPQLIPLDSWNAYGNAANNKKLISSVSVGGIPVGEFRSGNTQYVIDSNIADVEAVPAGENTEITVVQATAEHKFAYIQAKQGNYSVTYRIEFRERPRIYKANATIEKYQIAAVESDDVPQPEEAPPEFSIDGDNSTRWAAEGECSIIWDLGEVKPIESVMLSFWNGGERQSIFDLDISNDKVNWTEVYSGHASGEGEDLENFPIGETEGRYIRFRGHGTTTGSWQSVLEFVVPAVKPMPYTDVFGHWAEDTIEYMADQGLVNGISDSLFNPEGNITYAEGVTLLSRLLGLNVSTLDSVNWYDNYISAAEAVCLIPEAWYENGILNPDKQMTREEMCMLMVNAYSYKNKGKEIKTYNVISMFDDANEASAQGKTDIDKCLTLRLVNGQSKTRFAPQANITRAEATTIFERLYLLLN